MLASSEHPLSIVLPYLACLCAYRFAYYRDIEFQGRRGYFELLSGYSLMLLAYDQWFYVFAYLATAFCDVFWLPIAGNVVVYIYLHATATLLGRPVWRFLAFFPLMLAALRIRRLWVHRLTRSQRMPRNHEKKLWQFLV